MFCPLGPQDEAVFVLSLYHWPSFQALYAVCNGSIFALEYLRFAKLDKNFRAGF